MEDRRFIEESFPAKEVSEESAKEKKIRRGHISTLHIWWARRPLSSSRATSFASLIPASRTEKETRRERDFIVKLSRWENTLNETFLEEARQAILEANGGRSPRVLDPFAGGGAIPLEALRLGCETYASDYNPVATLILKCTLEYPQRYSGNVSIDQGLVPDKKSSKLLEEVRKRGGLILEETRKEIGRFYPTEKDGSIPIGYIWARTVPCQNPSCNAQIPLMRQYWLANTSKKKISLYPHVAEREVKFRIVGTGMEPIPKDFDPEKGTVSRAIAECLVCGTTVDDETMRDLFAGGRSGQIMVGVISRSKGSVGKRYRIANRQDIQVFKDAEEYLERKRELLFAKWGIDPIPDEPLPPTGTLGFRIQRYNMTAWGDLFNSRQKLVLMTLTEKVRDSYGLMIREGHDKEFARAVTSYLALTLSKITDWTNVLATWLAYIEKLSHAFTRQALPMTWDYCENVPTNRTSGSWEISLDVVLHGLDTYPKRWGKIANVSQRTATELAIYDEGYFDAVFTDPPYYDNIPYAHLSDFFYVWLKRSIGDLYPDLFSTPLTPKSKEIVAYSNIQGGWEAGKRFFEDMLKKSFIEINRILKPNGVSVIVYAHKSTAGWETLINSLIDSGLTVTGAWPIHTEMKMRLRATESAALASSIYMIARKFPRQETGFYREIKHALSKHLDHKLDMLWKEGISGADFFIAAIGSSIEVFGRYDRIIDDEGNIVRADKLLEEVRRIVTEYAVRQVLHNGFVAEITPLTRFYVLWRWGYGDVKLEFDDALKLARGVGIDITQEWNRGFIKKDKEFVRILGPEDRDVSQLKGSHELIDVLHNVLLLWNKGKNEEAVNILKETGFGKSDVFYRVAQAISESLPNGREKKLLEVFLSGKERITEHVREESVQTRLFQ